VIVNSEVPEFDYPVVSGGPAVVDKAETRYNGRGGVPINGLLRRLAFAARFRSKDLLFTTALQEGSKIIFNHLLPEGLMPLAPFLIYDPDPYIVIIDGKLQWINDAYTYSTLYPYSKRVERPLPPINYIRNSIKVVVDAYDGIPTFYVVDPTDPLVKCYQKIFPTLFTDGRQMTPQLRKHLRYPQLLFTIQAQMYCDYHMTDPDTFYRRADSWAMPIEKYADGRRMMEAYYVIMKLTRRRTYPASSPCGARAAAASSAATCSSFPLTTTPCTSSRSSSRPTSTARKAKAPCRSSRRWSCCTRIASSCAIRSVRPSMPPVAGAVAQPPRPRVASTARQLIQKAIELDAEARSLLSRGDLAGYQKKQQEQLELLKQLQKVIEQ